MSLKCKLEPHYHIPTPVLSILVGKLPKNTTTTPPISEQVVSLAPSTNLKQSHQAEFWDKDWSWGVDDEKPSSSQAQPTTVPVEQRSVPVSSSFSSTSPVTIPTDPILPTAAAACDTVSSSPSSSSSSTTSTCSFAPPVLAAPIGKEAYLVSASAAGKYIAMAYQRKFVVVALHPDQGEYIVIGQGSGCSDNGGNDLPSERITSILCLPLFVPSTRKNQIFIMIGYSTGWLRVYSSTGTLLTAQLLESSPIISIKLRTPPPPSIPSSLSHPMTVMNKQQKSQKQPIYASNAFGGTRHSHSHQQHQQHQQYHHQDDEEITLLFENNRVVSIDGQSLWMVLRVCDGQRESGIDASKMQTAFTYKKWQLDRQEKVRDIISLGPSVTPSPDSSSGSSIYLGGGSRGRSLRMGSSWWWWSTATNTVIGAVGAGGSGNGGDPTAAMTAAAMYSIMTPSAISSSSSSSASSSSSSISSSTSSTNYGLIATSQQQQQSPPFAEATSRYIAVGTHPMISFYATHEKSRPYMSAVSMASYMVSRVASPVFSFAKSWWSGTTSSNHDDSLSSSPGSTSPLSSSPSQQIVHNSKTPFVPEMPTPPQVIEQASSIPSLLHLSDPGRSIYSIQVAPPFQHSQHHTLAATSDALGRVILWDIQQGQMIRMWKGVRDAHCGWIQYQDEDGKDTNHHHRPRLLLFLVIYSARRGLLKVYQTRHGYGQQQKPVGVFHVGPGWHLVACAHEPLGSSMVSSGRKKAAMLQGDEECGVLSTCLLISPLGEVRKITITP